MKFSGDFGMLNTLLIPSQKRVRGVPRSAPENAHWNNSESEIINIRECWCSYKILNITNSVHLRLRALYFTKNTQEISTEKNCTQFHSACSGHNATALLKLYDGMNIGAGIPACSVGRVNRQWYGTVG